MLYFVAFFVFAGVALSNSFKTSSSVNSVAKRFSPAAIFLKRKSLSFLAFLADAYAYHICVNGI